MKQEDKGVSVRKPPLLSEEPGACPAARPADEGPGTAGGQTGQANWDPVKMTIVAMDAGKAPTGKHSSPKRTSEANRKVDTVTVLTLGMESIVSHLPPPPKEKENRFSEEPGPWRTRGMQPLLTAGERDEDVPAQGAGAGRGKDLTRWRTHKTEMTRHTWSIRVIMTPPATSKGGLSQEGEGAPDITGSTNRTHTARDQGQNTVISTDVEKHQVTHDPQLTPRGGE